MKSLVYLLSAILLLSLITTTEVTLGNLKSFFWATYDRDDDGKATLA
jgi:hypothetical protein